MGEMRAVQFAFQARDIMSHNHAVLGVVGIVRAADADAQTAAGEEAFDKAVKPFLSEYCASCHGDNEPEADVSLNRLSADLSDLTDAQSWQRILKQLELGEMPPEEERQPAEGGS